MVMARLHIICGNCGCNDMWEWEPRLKEVDEGEVMADEDVWLWCRNCSTLHSINNNAKRIIKEVEETPYKDAPWALKKIEGVKCKFCGDTSLEDKNACMQNGCPYHLDGDDGMY